MKNFQKLSLLSRKIRLLESIFSLLEWDQETYMPLKSAEIRAEQIALISKLAHKERCSPTYKKQLGQLIDLRTGKILMKKADAGERASLKNWRRDYLIANKLPNAFVADFTNLSSISMNVWRKAKEASDFSLFSPYLQKMVDMCKQKAEYLGYKAHPYNALLDLYEPEMTIDQLDPLFRSLHKKLQKLLEKILKNKPPKDDFLYGNFSEKKQLEFGELLLKKIGFDFDYGRLDLSAHPMSIAMHPHDSRITTRFSKSLFDCISAICHEAGHSFYEMGLDPEKYGTPLCEAISLGIHESQSRLWETIVGMSYPFWSYFFPLLQKSFPSLKKVSLTQFHKALLKVAPSPIRVEADEVTYPLHVMVRYELEKELIGGKIEVREVPEKWRDLMQKYLGITPKDDREGCLQDVHWSMGGFGYFPTYALGNLYAAQFFSAFAHDEPSWEEEIAAGNFAPLLSWLRKKIHKPGKLYSAAELVKKVSKKPLDDSFYIAYLTKRYETTC